MSVEEFRKEFKKIVYLNSLIKEKNTLISKLSVFDKNGSHKSAILLRIKEKEELTEKFKKALKGYNYEDWKYFSKKLSILNSKLRTAVGKKKKADNEISEICEQLANIKLI